MECRSGKLGVVGRRSMIEGGKLAGEIDRKYRMGLTGGHSKRARQMRVE